MSENIGLDFPLLISGPKEIPITKAQHSNLSFFGLASFMITYPIAIAEEEDKLTIYTNEWRARQYLSSNRFKGLLGWLLQTAEMGLIEVPKTHKLYNTLTKYFKHLFFKTDK